MAIDQNNLPGALALLDDHANRLSAYREFLQVTRLHLEFMRDRVPDVAAVSDRADVPDAELLRVLRIEVAVAKGELSRAAALLKGFQPRGRVARGQVLLLHALTLALTGDLDGAVAAARPSWLVEGPSADPGLQQGHNYVAVLALTLAGRLSDASDYLLNALSTGTVASYRDLYRTGALVWGSYVAQAQGRQEYAETLAAQAVATSTEHGPFPGMTSAFLRGVGASDLWAVIDDHLDRGYVVTALCMGPEAVWESPDNDRARRLAAVAEHMDGPLLGALGRLLVAVADEDAVALAEVAGEFSAIGAYLLSVQADLMRCVLLRRSGRLQEAAILAGEAWERAAVAGVECSGLFTRVGEDVSLSNREREILDLLVQSYTTAEVAAFLHLSTRTAESHLHNATRKVGVSGREALLKAYRTWLHPVS